MTGRWTWNRNCGISVTNLIWLELVNVPQFSSAPWFHSDDREQESVTLANLATLRC